MVINNTTISHSRGGLRRRCSFRRRRGGCRLDRRLVAGSLRACPTCRYHPTLHPRGYEDAIDAMAVEAAFAMRENVERDDAPSSSSSSSSSSLTKSDPVERAEAVAAAHAILANLSPDDIGGAGPLRLTAARAVSTRRCTLSRNGVATCVPRGSSSASAGTGVMAPWGIFGMTAPSRRDITAWHRHDNAKDGDYDVPYERGLNVRSNAPRRSTSSSA
jgi:hypothetical protein